MFRTSSNYQEDIEVEFTEIAEGIYEGKVNGVVYLTMKEDNDGNITYSFTKEADYHLVYSVSDLANNSNSIRFSVSIEVADKRAPIMSDGSNTINVDKTLAL